MSTAIDRPRHRSRPCAVQLAFDAALLMPQPRPRSAPPEALRCRSRPPGSRNKPGHNAGRPKGSTSKSKVET